jgi:hypothetical protein
MISRMMMMMSVPIPMYMAAVLPNRQAHDARWRSGNR